ncbi:peroxidase 1-like [Carex rostrata]
MILPKQLILALALVFTVLVPSTVCDLQVGFYNSSCPTAESLVQQTVAAAFANNTGIAAGLIRLHFHDCFVRGCDGSVLINTTANNTAERDSPANNPSLHGFDIIDTAKSAIEAVCPQTVSCADILAFAARDSINLTGSITYQVPSGRRDGTVSNATEATANLPKPTFNATELINNFAAKNLTAEEMVILSGAHTVGVSHCNSFKNRIYDSNNNSQVDSTLSPAYATLLQSLCPSNTDQFTPITTALDLTTPTTLDNNYYIGLQLTLGLLTSDQALLTNSTLNASVNSFASNQTLWQEKFINAMIKMGQIEVKTGSQGEVRLNCSVVNSGSSTAGFGSYLGSTQDGSVTVASF